MNHNSQKPERAINKMITRAHTSRSTDPPLIDILGVATLLGCSRGHVVNLDKGALIPRHVKIGRLKKWRPDEIHAWIAAGAPSREAWERRAESVGGTR
jgi:predicted DNA-binding transcriptional regulator AlpA